MGIIHVKNTAARIEVPVPQGLAFTGAGAVTARAGAGEFGLSLPTAATAYIVNVPISAHVGAWVSNLVNPGTSVADPMGFQLQQIYLWYMIGAVNLSVSTFVLLQETMLAGAARAAATGFNGNQNLSVVNNGTAGTTQPAATGVTLATAFSANVNLSVITLASPIWFSSDSTFVNGEIAMTTGAASGTATLLRIMLAGAVGMTA